MKRNLESIDFSANPHNIQIDDWVIRNNGDNLVGQVFDRVENKGQMLQFWVNWFDSTCKVPTPELASNLKKIAKEENGYIGKPTTEGLIQSMKLVGKKVKYEVLTELGTPRLLSRYQVEKKLLEDLPGQTNLLTNDNHDVNVYNQANKKNELSIVNVYSKNLDFVEGEIDLGKICIDYHFQQRTKMNEKVIEEYAIAYSEGVKFPPITIFDVDGTLYLIDGFHRLEAAKFANIVKLSCKIHKGSYREAFVYSLSVNSQHGLRRSNADKRAIALKLLNDDEFKNLSSRELGKIANVSHQLIHKIRKQIEAKEKELAEKSNLKAIDLIDNKSESDIDIQFNFRELPSDVVVKNEKEKIYAIEVNQTTLNLLCKYLQAEDLATAEGAIMRLLEG